MVERKQDDEITTLSVERRVRFELKEAIKGVVAESVNSSLTREEIADAVIQGVNKTEQALDRDILVSGVKRAQEESTQG